MNTYVSLRVASLVVLAVVAFGGLTSDAEAHHSSHVHNQAKVTCQINKIKEAVVGDITIDCDAQALVEDGGSSQSHIHNKAKVKCKIGKIQDSTVGDITINCNGNATVIGDANTVDSSHIHNKTNVQCKIGKIKDSSVGDITIICNGEATVVDGDRHNDGRSHISNKSNVKCKVGKIQDSTVGDVTISCDSKATVGPTPTPTPTPETPEDGDAGLRISKSDHRDITRPGHSLTYTLVLENTGTVDLLDTKVTDHVPSELSVTSVGANGQLSGNTITWNNISLDAGQKKTVSFTATVKSSVKDGTVIKNVATIKSDDRGISDNDADSTTVEVIKKAAVAGAKTQVKAVPVSARTGAAGVLTLLSTLTGASGLAFVIRKGF